MSNETTLSSNNLSFKTSGVDDVVLTRTANAHATLSSSTGNVRLSGLLNPVDAQDAATKNYVDSANANIALTSGNILVGNSSNIAAGVSMTGDSTITNAGVVTVNRIAGVQLGTTTATAGNILIGSGSAWNTTSMTGDSTMVSSGSVSVNRIRGAVLGTTTATAGNILIGSGSAWNTTAMTGDATMVSSGSLTVNRINLENDTTNANNFLVFSNVATGSQPLKTTSSCRYNPDLTTGGIFILNSPAATSSSTGAMINSGGEGIAKNIWIGSNFTAANTTTAGSVINVPAFTYTSSTANPTNVNIDTLNQITLNGTGTAANAASLYIAGPPIAGTLAITNPYSLQVASGNSVFGGNVSAVNHIQGYTTTVTSGGTTTLTVGSTFQQYFTGTASQTVVMPVASTLVLGQSWNIVNNTTTGTITINSSGSNLIVSLRPTTSVVITCILASGTSAASWSIQRIDNQQNTTYITSGTTYTTPAFITTETVFKITLVGGGGGGGGCAGSDHGAGGGAGGVGVFTINGLSPNTAYPIAIGTGGTAGAAGSGGAGNTGGTGGNTTFVAGSSTLQALGGSGGSGTVIAGTVFYAGGAGGATSAAGTISFSLNITGGRGGGGTSTNNTTTCTSGYGGSPGLGYGQGGAGFIGLSNTAGSSPGFAGTGYGAGGGGGFNSSAGGTGTSGLIVIEYNN